MVGYADNRAVSFYLYKLLNLKYNAILYQFKHDCRWWSAYKTVKRCRGYTKMLLASVNYNICICDSPTTSVRFSFAWILVVEILDGGCGADTLKTQMTWVNGVYWPGEVQDVQTQRYIRRKIGGRSVAGATMHGASQSGLSYPKQGMLTFDTTESSTEVCLSL